MEWQSTKMLQLLYEISIRLVSLLISWLAVHAGEQVDVDIAVVLGSMVELLEQARVVLVRYLVNAVHVEALVEDSTLN